MKSDPRRVRALAGMLAYPIMIGGAIGVFLLIRAAGSTLVAPAPAAAAGTATSATGGTLFHVLLALAAVLVAARSAGALCKRIHQPAVIGEIIAGLCLGPSLLGRLSPTVMHYVLPESVTPFLAVIAQIGVVFFMFLVGLDIDTGQLKTRVRATIAISHASILLPFVLGAALALWLYPTLSTGHVSFTVFALFVALSLSVTAFPVLARILTDRGIHQTTIGTVALTCAAVGDITAWCLLAFVIATAKAKVLGAVVTLGLTALYLALMLLVARPLVIRAVRAHELRTSAAQTAFAIVVLGVLLSALSTEAAGVHAIFGAFVLGAIIPHDSRLARELIDKLGTLVLVLFLPVFFAFTGLRTEIGLVQGASQWLIFGVILAAAFIGKFGGAFVAARLTGFGSRDAASLGILMNTRGLVELIVLNIGLDLNILSPTLFTMLVLMAVITTVATTPILDLLRRNAAVPSVAPTAESVRRA